MEATNAEILRQLQAHDQADTVRFGNIDEQLALINDKQDKLLAAVIGDERYGQAGLVKRVEKLEVADDDWRAKYQKFTGIMLVIVGIGAPLLALIFTWISDKIK